MVVQIMTSNDITHRLSQRMLSSVHLLLCSLSSSAAAAVRPPGFEPACFLLSRLLKKLARTVSPDCLASVWKEGGRREGKKGEEGREEGREGEREGGREGGRERRGKKGGRKGGRERGREGGREGEREGGREGGRERGRERGREGGRNRKEQWEVNRGGREKREEG